MIAPYPNGSIRLEFTRAYREGARGQMGDGPEIALVRAVTQSMIERNGEKFVRGVADYLRKESVPVSEAALLDLLSAIASVREKTFS